MLIQIVVLVEMLPIAIESETTQTLQDKDLNGFFLGGGVTGGKVDVHTFSSPPRAPFLPVSSVTRRVRRPSIQCETEVTTKSGKDGRQGAKRGAFVPPRRRAETMATAETAGQHSEVEHGVKPGKALLRRMKGFSAARTHINADARRRSSG